MPLAEVRAAVADAWRRSPGDVEAFFADEAPLAGGSAGEAAWSKTVEEVQLFGRRVTCILGEPKPGLWEELSTELEAIEGGVAQVEVALTQSQLVAGQAYTKLAQLEARLQHLEGRGIDSADAAALGVGDREAGHLRRRELTRRAELVHARLEGLFVGLGAARVAQSAAERVAGRTHAAPSDEVAEEAAVLPLRQTGPRGEAAARPAAKSSEPPKQKSVGSQPAVSSWLPWSWLTQSSQ